VPSKNRTRHCSSAGKRSPPSCWAGAVAAANKTIRALIILARVICGDETPLRAGPGPKWNKKYLHVACTSLLTCYFLGDRPAGWLWQSPA
jgi:hypothetical protein